MAGICKKGTEMLYRVNRRQFVQGSIGLVGLAIAACSPAAAPTPAAPATGGQTTGAKTPKRGGIIRAAVASEPPHLDPTLETAYASHSGPGAPYSRLLRYKVGPGSAFESRTMEADVAASWEQPDPTTYIFKIRPNVKWHAIAPVNGRVFTSDDARWSIEYYMNPANKSPHASLFTAIAKIENPDKDTLKITLKEPQAMFLDNAIASHYAKMVAKEVFEKDGSFKNTTVGTGPFMLEKWDRGVKMTFKRNPEYFESGKPYIDGFEWITIPDYASRVAALRAGEIDYGPEPAGVQPEDIDSVKKSNPELTWLRQQRANYYWIAANITKKPFDDVRVRQAISYAIDRREMIKVAFFGDGTVESIVPQAMSEWVLPEAEREATFGKRDVAKAKQLLTAAGYPNGIEAEMISRASQGYEIALVEAAAAMLKDAGINVSIKIQQLPEWTKSMTDKTYQMSQGLGQGSFEPDDWTYLLYHSKSSRNWWGFNDPKADALLEKQRIQTNPTERKQTILEIQRYLNEQLPVVPLVFRFENVPVYPYVKDLQTHWSYGCQYFKECWIDK